MGKSIDIGINNLAERIKGGCIGIDNVARKIKAGWIGIDGVARQFYSSGAPKKFLNCRLCYEHFSGQETIDYSKTNMIWASSDDGINWGAGFNHSMALPYIGSIGDVIYTDGAYIISCSSTDLSSVSNIVLCSDSLDSFTQVNVPAFFQYLNYANGKILATDSDGNIYESTNKGRTWTKHATVITEAYYGYLPYYRLKASNIIYTNCNGYKYIADVINSHANDDYQVSYLAYSTDLTNWVEFTKAYDETDGPYNNREFGTLMEYSKSMYEIDGEIYLLGKHKEYLWSTGDFNMRCSGGGHISKSDIETSLTTKIACTINSRDMHSITSYRYANNMLRPTYNYDKKELVYAGRGRSVNAVGEYIDDQEYYRSFVGPLRSTGGWDSSEKFNPIWGYWYDIEYANGLYVIASSHLAVLYSYDGKTWTEINLDSDQEWYTFIYSGRIYYPRND